MIEPPPWRCYRYHSHLTADASKLARWRPTPGLATSTRHPPAIRLPRAVQRAALGGALLGQRDQRLPHVRMPVEVVEHWVGRPRRLLLALGRQVRPDVRMPVQERVDRFAEGGIALLRIRARRRQCRHRRNEHIQEANGDPLT